MPYKDPERRRRYARDWIKRNPEKARDAMRKWRETHPDAHNAEKRAYYGRHRERILAQNAEYHRMHPEVRKASDNRRRIAKSIGGPSFTSAEWLALVERLGGRCAYCGACGPLQADHRVPVARGGRNDISNILPACRSCNARKHLMTEDEFRARLASEGPSPPTI